MPDSVEMTGIVATVFLALLHAANKQQVVSTAKHIIFMVMFYCFSKMYLSAKLPVILLPDISN